MSGNMMSFSPFFPAEDVLRSNHHNMRDTMAAEGESRPVVYIIEDDTSLQTAYEVVASGADLELNFFSTVAEFRELSHYSRPCCLVLDLSVGEELQMELTDAGHSIPIIFHTRDADIETAVRVMERGAMTVLQMPASIERLTKYLEAGIEIDKNHLRLDQTYREIEQILGELTVRQRWILDRMVDGMPSKKIARKLEVSKRTVETERSAILRTFNVQSTPDVTLQIGQFRMLAETHVSSERRSQVAARLLRKPNSISSAAKTAAR